MTHASLFSGIGGPEVAAAMLGWQNAFHCEINPFGREVLEYWFPDSVSYEDITKTDFRQWRGKIDILTGGFPCQPFSYAGKRGGRDDDRYLWPQMLRVIDEVRPTWVIGENVAGITTMVEGGVLAPMGAEATLFGEGDGVHRYGLKQSFTIERICKDLEQHGYDVQPVLIPAAAVGAPHRRDRVFIIAYATNADLGDDQPNAGDNESESGKERLQERNEVRLAGGSDHLRSAVPGSAEDPLRDGLLCGQSQKQGDKRNERDISARDSQRICGEERTDIANPSSEMCNRRRTQIGHQRQTDTNHEEQPLFTTITRYGEGRVATDPYQYRGSERDKHLQSQFADGAEPFGNGGQRNAADTTREQGYGNGLEQSQDSGKEQEQSGGRGGKNGGGQYSADTDNKLLLLRDGKREEGWGRPKFRAESFDGHLLPQERWASFPTVSPVHAGNDGIPFGMDGASIPFSRWRTESLKAYGNAIVVQVMYQIFKCIQSITRK